MSLDPEKITPSTDVKMTKVITVSVFGPDPNESNYLVKVTKVNLLNV